MPPPIKRRRTEPTVVEEITFDLSARQDYLTGFHKRKLQRAKHAQEAAARRAREEKLADRKNLREHRKIELERHVEEVNAMLRPPAPIVNEQDQSDSEEDGNDTSDAHPPSVDHEAEYVDEEKYTTVSVESMEVSKDGLFKAQEDDAGPATHEVEDLTTAPTSSDKQKRPWTKERLKDSMQNKRKKKRNFRYEGKVERKEARSRQSARNRKQARERRADG